MIILDLMLPGDDGLILCRNLRARSQIPIIMLTASGQQQAPMEAAQKGANRFLTQPISSWELNRVVTECLSIAEAQSI